MLKYFITKISTKSFARNIAKLNAEDKVTASMWGVFICTASLTTYETWRRGKLDLQIRSDGVLNRRDSTTIFHGLRK